MANNRSAKSGLAKDAQLKVNLHYFSTHLIFNPAL